MVFRYVQYILLLLLVSSPLSAQFEQFYESWRWAHFTTKSGLPSNSIDDIIQAEDGTLWVSTKKGIAWYDGYRWNEISVDPNSPDNRVTKLSRGIKQNVLVVHNELLFSGNSSGFHQIQSPLVSIDRVISAAVVDDSMIAISTYHTDRPFLMYNPENNDVQILHHSNGIIRRTKSNKVMIGNANGLFELRDRTIAPIIPYGFVRAISENTQGDGVLSMDSPYNQIGVWEWSNNRTPRLSTSERSLPVRALDISSAGEVIVAYETGDIRVRNKDIWESLKPVPSQMIGLNCLYFDSADNLWVGSESGLFFYRKTLKKWSWWKHGFSDPRNVVMEIYESTKGDVWIGNMDGIELHKSDGSVSFIDRIGQQPLGLVTGIAEDQYGNIWISSGSSFNGAYRWNGEQWKHYGPAEGLLGPRIHKIKSDLKRNLWFLSLPDKGESLDTLHERLGAYRYDGAEFTRIGKREGLMDGRVYSFAETDDTTQWFGTKTGISRLTPSGWEYWDKSKLKRLSSVYCMAADHHGNLWFSTFTSVLGYIDRSGEVHWVWDWVSDSDYKQKVWDIKVDEDGVVWVATTKGLFSFINGVWSNYDIESEYGLKELRVVLPRKEKIFIGGHGVGVGVFQRNRAKVPIKIGIDKPIIESDRVFIKWSIDVYWKMMSSDDIEVRYKLDENDWSEWSKSREAVFNSLASGDHRFEIQVKDLYGQFAEGKYVQEFTVPPPPYKNLWIVIPFLLMIVTIVSLIIRNNLLAEHHKKLILEQRTRIANDLHDEVGSNLASIALIGQRILKDGTLPQVVREELSVIRDTAIQTGDFLRDIVWYINPRYDTFMSLETRLREIAGRMLRELNVQIEMNNTGRADELFVESRRNIILMFKEIIHNIVKHAQSSQVIIHCEHSKDVFRLMVKDNGVGFHQKEIMSGNGLLSLKRRARDAGAELKISSNLGEGTTITITFHANVTEL